MAKSKKQLLADFNKLKLDWYSIYHEWGKGSLTVEKYTEDISAILLDHFETIKLIDVGLRKDNFRMEDHKGLAPNKYDKAGRLEPRLCIAMFNARWIDQLGVILDYEVPLKLSINSKHGNVDLLCLRDDTLLVVEAKQPASKESLLKAMLEAFVYSRLVAKVKGQILKEYGLPCGLKLSPAILTFTEAESFKQLKYMYKYPNLWELCHRLNVVLAVEMIEPFEFHVICAQNIIWNNSLTTKTLKTKEKFVVFKKGITLSTRKIKFP